jgi:hypothetical protein
MNTLTIETTTGAATLDTRAAVLAEYTQEQIDAQIDSSGIHWKADSTIVRRVAALIAALIAL